MNRRGFLGGLLAALAAPAIIRMPGLLMPVKRLVMPDSAGMAMANHCTATYNGLLTPSMITRETLILLENRLIAAGKVNRQFNRQFARIGAALLPREPFDPGPDFTYDDDDYEEAA